MNQTKYGHPIEFWNRAKEETKSILIDHARRRQMIPYSNLVERIHSIHLEPNDYALASLLGEVSTEEDEAGRGLLTVLVVHKTGDYKPGPGFFELAKERGRNVKDIDKTWVEEMTRVIDHWSKH